MTITLAISSFTQLSLAAGRRVLAARSTAERKAHGQFLTPEPLAQFMAQQLGPLHDGDRVLDPAMGSGTLLCAVIDRAVAEGKPRTLWIDGFELDPALFATAGELIRQAADHAERHGIHVYPALYQTDFVLNGLQFLRPSLLAAPVGRPRYRHIIANPPYFKINPDDARRQEAEGLLNGHTNIYTLFMGLAATMLDQGCACFIVPRSFCSGAYFARFRRDFLARVAIRRVHLFEARDDAFSGDTVLQENVVITFTPRQPGDAPPVELSTSPSLAHLAAGVTTRSLTPARFVSPSGLLRLPASEVDDMILDAVDRWHDTLHSYQMEISTGPVVAFRAAKYLTDEPNGQPTVPLLWLQHVRPQQVTWPLDRAFHKPQYISLERSLLVANANYVLLRRFSAKEEARRLVAAPWLAADFAFELVGLENHLNYIYGRDRQIGAAEAVGLSAFLNSGLIDRYVRISNGNTQVNATELRALPLPPVAVIHEIGALMLDTPTADLDAVVFATLRSNRLIPDRLPILRETRFL